MNRYLEAQHKVIADVCEQSVEQIKNWGFQTHTFEEWTAIFEEELAEFRCNVIVAKNSGYTELIHVVAVGLAWLANIKMDDKIGAEPAKEKK